ncbi:hypothetical protein QUC31_000542 [Theobroma cacao]
MGEICYSGQFICCSNMIWWNLHSFVCFIYVGSLVSLYFSELDYTFLLNHTIFSSCIIW